jgi:hypothetical protein
LDSQCAHRICGFRLWLGRFLLIRFFTQTVNRKFRFQTKETEHPTKGYVRKTLDEALWLAALLEELLEQLGRLKIPYPTNDFNLMILPRIRQDVVQGAGGARLGVRGAENDAREA